MYKHLVNVVLRGTERKKKTDNESVKVKLTDLVELAS